MARSTSLLAACVLALAALVAAPPARAESDLFSRDTISGLVDVRLGAADGEPSWLRAGYGKAVLGGGGDDIAVRPFLDLAIVAWKPDLGHDVSAYLSLQDQPGQDHGVDAAEAFLVWRPAPTSATRISARAGLFWPPFSLEHDGAAWTTTRTLTPSAANTWIAEEVKVAGLEGAIAQEVGNHRLSATAAVFGDNDTSGTLLSFRGWALDDVRTTLFGSLPLPRFSPTQAQNQPGQNDEAVPTMELDHRLGGYLKLEWRPPAPVVLEASYYDNGGDPHLLRHGQWSWRTSFYEAGLTWRPAPGLEVLAQVLNGRTYFGELTPLGWYVDVGFTAGYALVTRTWSRHRLTARVDVFENRDRSFAAFDNQAEDGRAFTGDYAFAVNDRLSLWIEAMHVDSERASRAYLGFRPHQDQTLLQAALRFRV